jgi:fucose permease
MQAREEDMPDFLMAIGEFVQNTQVPRQFREVDARGLFTNIYFLLPFLAVIGHFVYHKAVGSLILLALGVGIWIVSGSPLMQDLVVNGELQMGKVLPVAGVGMVIIAVLVYVLFLRSE